MRVTYGMMTDSLKSQLSQISHGLMDAQDRASSGKRIFKPSDDVAAIGRCLSYNSTLASIDQYERNSNVASSLLSVSNSTLDSVVNQITQVRKLAIQAGTSIDTEGSVDAIIGQLNKVSEQLQSLANTQYIDKYIFAGGLTDAKPVVPNTAAGAPYTYKGDTDQFTIQIGPGVSVPTTVTGDKVFNMGSAAVAGTPDVFSMIQNLKTAVKSGDVTSVSNQIQDIQKNLDNVVNIRSQIGGCLKQVQSNQTALQASKTTVSELLSETEDVDLAESIIDLQTRQNIYQAAISVAGKVLQTTLADFLQ